MDILFFSEFIVSFLDVCKHFKLRFNDNYVSTMCEDGKRKDLTYEQFKIFYVLPFIQIMMTDDSGGDK